MVVPRKVFPSVAVLAKLFFFSLFFSSVHFSVASQSVAQPGFMSQGWAVGRLAHQDVFLGFHGCVPLKPHGAQCGGGRTSVEGAVEPRGLDTSGSECLASCALLLSNSHGVFDSSKKTRRSLRKALLLGAT